LNYKLKLTYKEKEAYNICKPISTVMQEITHNRLNLT